MPDAATIPNRAMPAPPSTARGTPSTTAETLGISPSTTRMTPAAVATQRERDAGQRDQPDVLRESRVRERVEDAADHRAEAVGAQAVGELTCALTGFSTISPTAIMSPVVSVMITMPTMSIETIEATWKVGRPKWNGVTRANQCGLADGRPVDHPRNEQRGDGAEDQTEQDRDALRAPAARTAR